MTQPVGDQLAQSDSQSAVEEPSSSTKLPRCFLVLIEIVLSFSRRGEAVLRSDERFTSSSVLPLLDFALDLPRAARLLPSYIEGFLYYDILIYILIFDFLPVGQKLWAPLPSCSAKGARGSLMGAILFNMNSKAISFLDLCSQIPFRFDI